MSKVSVLRKFGVVARVAREQAGRSRTLNAVLGAVRTTGRSFLHVLHHLWLEVTGTVFLAMALFGGFELVRECMEYKTGHAPASHVVIMTCFTLAFAWFGLSSFWKVRSRNHRS